MAWKQGQSGNIKGRPKSGKAMTDLLRNELNRRDIDKVPIKEKVVKALINKALEGDPTALKYVFDRLDGRPMESVSANVTGNIIDMDAIQKKLEDALLNDHGAV